MYKILNYSLVQARKLGVIIKPSKLKGKKIDVISRTTGNKIASIGAVGYLDYPYFKKKYGKKYADAKRNNYWRRHRKNAYRYGSAGYYAARILW